MKIVHHMTTIDYHANPAVSNSSLKWFRKSPAHYKAWREGKIPNEPSKAQQMGSLIHAWVLEGKQDWVCAPETYPTGKSDKLIGGEEVKPWNRNASYCKDWEAIQTKQVISQDQRDVILQAGNAVTFNRFTDSLFGNGRPEVSLFATCPNTGLQLKARLDWLCVYLPKPYIVDLKTCADGSTHGFSRAIAKYDYATQAAFYRYVSRLCNIEVVDFYFIALELEPLPMVNVLMVSENDIEIASKRLHRTLEELAECEQSGVWPGYCGEAPHIVTLPVWAHGEGEEQQLTGAIEL